MEEKDKYLKDILYKLADEVVSNIASPDNFEESIDNTANLLSDIIKTKIILRDYTASLIKSVEANISGGIYSEIEDFEEEINNAIISILK